MKTIMLLILVLFLSSCAITKCPCKPSMSFKMQNDKTTITLDKDNKPDNTFLGIRCSI